jgi:hypothetical protein
MSKELSVRRLQETISEEAYSMKWAFLALLLAFGFESLACKQTSKAADRAGNEAVKSYIKNESRWKGYKITKISHKNGIYVAFIRKGKDKTQLRFELDIGADCTITVNQFDY